MRPSAWTAATRIPLTTATTAAAAAASRSLRGVTAPYSREGSVGYIAGRLPTPDPTGSPKVTRMKSRRSDAARPVTIDGFEMGERIGSGGFSVVYRARQQSMNREVAIKVLNTGFATDAERRTFERECHALGRLSHHPNIVTVFDDAITDDGRPCIVMELYSSTYPRASRGDRATADRRGARRRRAHLRCAPDRP